MIAQNFTSVFSGLLVTAVIRRIKYRFLAAIILFYIPQKATLFIEYQLTRQISVALSVISVVLISVVRTAVLLVPFMIKNYESTKVGVAVGGVLTLNFMKTVSFFTSY
jgi:hypothetical protein